MVKRQREVFGLKSGFLWLIRCLFLTTECKNRKVVQRWSMFFSFPDLRPLLQIRPFLPFVHGNALPSLIQSLTKKGNHKIVGWV